MPMSAKNKAAAILQLRSEGQRDAQIIAENPKYQQGFKWLLDNPGTDPSSEGAEPTVKRPEPAGARGSGSASLGIPLPAENTSQTRFHVR